MRLRSKRALILGGGGAGIRRSVTRAYAAEGASIAVADVDPARAQAAAVVAADAAFPDVLAERKVLPDVLPASPASST